MVVVGEGEEEVESRVSVYGVCLHTSFPQVPACIEARRSPFHMLAPSLFVSSDVRVALLFVSPSLHNGVFERSVVLISSRCSLQVASPFVPTNEHGASTLVLDLGRRKRREVQWLQWCHYCWVGW